jgi:hypothetical protein
MGCPALGVSVAQKTFLIIAEMGCPALQLGIWVAFLKQPALPGEAPETTKNSKK